MTDTTECMIDCPTTSDDEGPNTLLIVLIVTIPCSLVIILLACLSIIICYLILRHRDNPDESEAAYAKRRFHQGLSLEEQRKMQKKKSRGNKKELFRKRKSLQSNPKLVEDRPEKPHIRHNPLQLREWQMRMSTKEAGAGEVDTEETDIATDIDADAEEFFQQINDRRTFGSFGAINPLLIQQMGAFRGHHPGYDTPPRDPRHSNGAAADRHTRPQASGTESEQSSESSSSDEGFSPYDT